jgi:hypothetical protein
MILAKNSKIPALPSANKLNQYEKANLDRKQQCLGF